MNTAAGTETTPLVITTGDAQASITFSDSADANIVEKVRKMLLTNYQEMMEYLTSVSLQL